ncbi:hypothetical protein ACU8LZ_04045 [Rhizobium leguminosarum]
MRKAALSFDNEKNPLRAEGGPTAFAYEAQAILQGLNWVDPVERRRAYDEQGRTRFDDTLDPYAPEQIAQERYRNRRTA